jgi:chemotaxis protein methyltransferase CheR
MSEFQSGERNLIDTTTSDGIDQSLRISVRSFDQLAEFITREFGIKMPESKISMIQSRLLHRVRDLGLESIDQYCEHLFSSSESAAERVHFINAVTTNKTDFFREPQHFKYLTETVLPQLVRSGYVAFNRRVALWSAACSSGEEPYTLAMVLSEYAAGHPAFQFRILATDISTKVLKMAKDGIYSEQQVAPVPPQLRRKYLLQGKGEQHSLTRVTSALRRSVSFHPLNLMDADYCVRDMFDVIFCRNVLIYFERPTQEAVISKLCRNLNPGGYIFVGHSESLSGFDLPLDSVGSACFRKRGE